METPTVALISTNIAYAPDIEEGARLVSRGQVTGSTRQRLNLRSSVGGFHSVKLTLGGWERIVGAALEESGEGRGP
jgi:hypothetical protein